MVDFRHDPVKPYLKILDRLAGYDRGKCEKLTSLFYGGWADGSVRREMQPVYCDVWFQAFFEDHGASAKQTLSRQLLDIVDHARSKGWRLEKEFGLPDKVYRAKFFSPSNGGFECEIVMDERDSKPFCCLRFFADNAFRFKNLFADLESDDFFGVISTFTQTGVRQFKGDRFTSILGGMHDGLEYAIGLYDKDEAALKEQSHYLLCNKKKKPAPLEVSSPKKRTMAATALQLLDELSQDNNFPTLLEIHQKALSASEEGDEKRAIAGAWLKGEIEESFPILKPAAQGESRLRIHNPGHQNSKGGRQH